MIDISQGAESEKAEPQYTKRGVLQYIWRVSAKHQLFAGSLAILVSLLALAPVELQRRIVDHMTGVAKSEGSFPEPALDTLYVLGAAYLAIIILFQLAKRILGIYQDWISETVTYHARPPLIGTFLEARKVDEDYTGRAVGVVVNETDRLSQFVGTGLSNAAADIALFVGLITYMLVIEPTIALYSFLFFIPQIIIAPVIQKRLNRLNHVRVHKLRELSDRVSARDCDSLTTLLDRIFSNQMWISITKNTLKAIRNLLIALPTLSVLMVGGYMVMNGETTVGVIVAFISGFQKLSDPFRSLLDFYTNAEKARVQHHLIAKWRQEPEKT